MTIPTRIVWVVAPRPEIPWAYESRAVQVLDTCPLCGERRGRVLPSDPTQGAVDRWENLCGHKEASCHLLSEASALPAALEVFDALGVDLGIPDLTRDRIYLLPGLSPGGDRRPGALYNSQRNRNTQVSVLSHLYLEGVWEAVVYQGDGQGEVTALFRETYAGSKAEPPVAAIRAGVRAALSPPR